MKEIISKLLCVLMLCACGYAQVPGTAGENIFQRQNIVIGDGYGGTGADINSNGVGRFKSITADSASIGIDLGDLSDVTLTTPVAGHILIKTTGGDWVNVPFSGDAFISEAGYITIQPNTVALTTDTTGSYVATVQAGTGIATTGASSGEGIAHTISLSFLGLQSLTDPNDDRLIYWDDSDGVLNWIDPVSGKLVTTSGDGLTFEYNAATGDVSLNANEVAFAVNGLIFEGATADTIETRFQITDPTSADKTITFPNSDGTIILSGHTFTNHVTGTLGTGGTTALTLSFLGLQNLTDPGAHRLMGWNDTSNAIEWFNPNVMYITLNAGSAYFTMNAASGDISLPANYGAFAVNGLVFEGATDDTIETRIQVIDPTTTDKTITIPNADGYVILSGHTFASGDITGTLDTDGSTVLTIDAAGSRDGTKFLRDDKNWAVPAGGGDVTGPGTSLAGQLAYFSDTSGTDIDASAIKNVSDELYLPNNKGIYSRNAGDTADIKWALVDTGNELILTAPDDLYLRANGEGTPANVLFGNEASLNFYNTSGRAWFYNTTTYAGGETAHFRFYLPDSTDVDSDAVSFWAGFESAVSTTEKGYASIGLANMPGGGYSYGAYSFYNDRMIVEGATVDAYETTLAFTDPTTSDKTITFPNDSGTIILSGDTFSGDVTGTLEADGDTPLSLAADSVGANEISFLGLESLTDQNDDRIAFWDDSAGTFAWLDPIANNIEISTVNIRATRVIPFYGGSIWPKASGGCAEPALGTSGAPSATFDTTEVGMWLVHLPKDFDGSVENITIGYMQHTTAAAITFSYCIDAASEGDTFAEGSYTDFTPNDTPGGTATVYYFSPSASGMLGSSSNADKDVMVWFKVTTTGGAVEIFSMEIQY